MHSDTAQTYLGQMTPAGEPANDQRAALRTFREYGRSLVPDGTDVLEDFLAERRANARAEESELS